MKIAVFGTMWNEEVMNYYYRGFNEWAKQSNGIVDMFVCYGRLDVSTPFNYGEYAMFDFPNLEEYDGAIMIASTINEDSVRQHLTERIRKSGIPCVVMDYRIDGFSSIYIDQERYVKELVHHLVDCHHAEQICYVGGPKENVESERRLSGFLLGMKESGLTCREDWLFEKTFCFNDGYDVVEELLGREEPLPDAIVCANDDMAVGASEALLEAGIEVGKDCLVTGFDQYFIGENYAPSLTTIRRPRESMAYHACQMLSESYGNADYMEQANIVYGQTCGCKGESFKNNMAFRRIVFNTFNNREVLSDVLTQMEESMIVGDSLCDVVDNVQRVLRNFEKGRCRILLQPELEENPNLTYHSYGSCTKEFVIWQDDKDSSDIADGHAFVYAPIHFLDHMYGYCVFRDIGQFLSNHELYNFTKSLGFSLENMVQKKRYTIVNDKLQGLYETDYLTGAYNRHGFAKYAQEMLAESRVNRRDLQVIFADIDGLKAINDIHGHEAGDTTIRMVGHALMRAADAFTKVFRYGGDEFLILSNGDTSFDAYKERVERYLLERQEALQLPYQITASVGCVVASPGENRALDDYINEADALMYEIKQNRHCK